MTGIRVWTASDPDRPRDRGSSYFARFFGPVLPRLRPLVWLADEQGFRPPAEWDCGFPPEDDARREWTAEVPGGPDEVHVGNRFFILTDGFVNDYADYCNDDWNDLYGFAAPPADWREWLRRRLGGRWCRRLDWPTAERAKFLADTADVCLFAVDFAYWEFFARDAGLIGAARLHLAGLPGVRVEDADLAASVGV